MHEIEFEIPSVEEIKEEKIGQIAESLAVSHRGMDSHWGSLMAMLAKMASEGVLPVEVAKELVAYIEHCIEQTQQVQWRMAQGTMTLFTWAKSADTEEERSRRLAKVGLSIVVAKAKITRAKTEEDLRKIIAEWDFEEVFSDAEHWDWEGDGSRVKERIPEEIKKAIKETLGVDIQVDLSKLEPGVPMIGQVVFDEDGKPIMKAVTAEEFEADTGMNFQEFMAKKASGGIIEIEGKDGKVTSKLISQEEGLDLPTALRRAMTAAKEHYDAEHAPKPTEADKPTLGDLLPGLNWKKNKEKE